LQKGQGKEPFVTEAVNGMFLM